MGDMADFTTEQGLEALSLHAQGRCGELGGPCPECEAVPVRRVSSRGTCAVCGYRVNLRKPDANGVRCVGIHWVYYGSTRVVCAGSLNPPKENPC